MSDAYAAPPESPARMGCLAYAGLFLLGFVGIGALFLLVRAPGRTAADTIGDKITPPSGYARLDDAEAGAGEQSAGDVESLLGVRAPGFERAVSRAWGKAPDEPSRAVVVLVVRLSSPGDATTLADAYVAAHRATAFSAPAPLRGFQDGPDAGHRYAQRVVFTRDAEMWVVSIVTPAKENDTSEVVRVALAQQR